MVYSKNFVKKFVPKLDNSGLAFMGSKFEELKLAHKNGNYVLTGVGGVG